MSVSHKFPKNCDREGIIALDLEGTLVSNAASQFPRPGIAGFFEFCREYFTKVVIFSAVRPHQTQKVLNNLVACRDVPEWVIDTPIVIWARHYRMYKPGIFNLTDSRYKDLRFIQEMYPGVHLDDIWLVDDDEAFIAPGQESQWIPIDYWDYKSPSLDLELQRVQDYIAEFFCPYVG